MSLYRNRWLRSCAVAIAIGLVAAIFGVTTRVDNHHARSLFLPPVVTPLQDVSPPPWLARVVIEYARDHGFPRPESAQYSKTFAMDVDELGTTLATTMSGEKAIYETVLHFPQPEACGNEARQTAFPDADCSNVTPDSSLFIDPDTKTVLATLDGEYYPRVPRQNLPLTQ
ncbi:MAG: hypothetical protein LLG14_08345 [Nocardiaceae bacterium]|nr:hypothetical protein [Nocardiaceae bacterium]